MSDEQKKVDPVTGNNPEGLTAESGDHPRVLGSDDMIYSIEPAKEEMPLSEIAPMEKKSKKKESFFKRHKYLCCIGGGFVLFVLLLLIFLGPILHFAIETFAPKAIGVPVTIGDLDLKLFSGQLKLKKVKLGDSKGLNSDHLLELDLIDLDLLKGCVDIKEVKISNPEGFQAKQILTLKKARLDLERDSIFEEKLIIEELTVTGLDLYYEPKIRGDDNIAALQAYIKKTFPTSQKKPKDEDKDKEPQKIQINELNLTEINIHTIIMGQDLTIPMLPFKLRDLGTGEEGVTGGEVALAILDQLSFRAISTIADYAKTLGVEAEKLFDNIGEQSKTILKNASDSVKGIKNLF